jgi:hypothetical protein
MTIRHASTWSALLLGFAALLGCVNQSTAPAPSTPQPPGPCQPTQRQPFPGGLPGYPTTALVGGNLAYLGSSTWRVSTEEKAPFLWRTEPHSKRLFLRAERIDATRAAITFDLGPPQESPDGSRFPAEWGGNLLYGGYVGLGGPKLPELGCWRLAVVGGSTTDAIVVEVVPKN